MPKKVPGSTLPTLDDQEVRDLAMKIFRNEVFTDRHIDPNDHNLIGTIFMPLAMMTRKDALNLRRKQRPGMLYAPMENAGPRSINGYPMFFEVSMISQPDSEKVWEEFKRLNELSGHDAQSE